MIAFLYFESPEAAEASLVLNGEKFGDNSITVDLDSEDRTAEVKPHQTIVVGNLKYGEVFFSCLKWNVASTYV